VGVDQTTAVKDQAVAFNIALAALAVLTAAATFAISLIPPGNWLVGIRILAGCLAVATAVVGFFKFRNERAFKRQQKEERVTLDQALKAESRRTSLLINGAMLGTADKLRRLSVLDQASKDVEISGFRTSIVSKVCDLVQSEARGLDATGAWTLPELQDLLDEWLLAGWQPRPHDGLRDPLLPRRAVSPNEMYARVGRRCGLSAVDAIR
jgi:hypothetical protein